MHAVCFTSSNCLLRFFAPPALLCRGHTPAVLLFPSISTSNPLFFRYASLYFCLAVESQENELLALEIIHRYVELLDKYFGNVFHCFSSPFIQQTTVVSIQIQKFNFNPNQSHITVLFPLTISFKSKNSHMDVVNYANNQCIHRCVSSQVCELDIIFNFEKAYFILDEFLMGGEVQETSKQTVNRCIEASDMLQEVSCHDTHAHTHSLALIRYKVWLVPVVCDHVTSVAQK